MNLALKEKRQQTSDTISFIFSSDQPLSWSAGQFLKYTLDHPDMDDRKNERYFTISSAPHEKDIWLTTRFAPEKGSTFKTALRNLEIGAAISAEGPDGDFTIDDPTRDFVFVAAGMGITPYRAILLDLAEKKLFPRIKLLYSNRNAEFVFQNELEAFRSAHPNLEITYFVNPERIDEKLIQETGAMLKNPMYYISGPEPMVEQFEKSLPPLGIREEDTKRDYFPGYAWPQ